MWPSIDKTKKTIDWGGFQVEDFNKEEIQNPQTTIKEIVMVYASYGQVSYDKSEVPLAVSYDTPYGLHIILFSKVTRLKYENRGIPWTATFSSDKSLYITMYDDGEYMEEESLTEMFKNMLAEPTLSWEVLPEKLPELTEL